MYTCGVYRIYHKQTEQEYIGSSIEIEERIAHHKFCLKNNRHTSGRLQLLWNNTTPDSWEFETLEVCPPEARLNREQYYIDNSSGLLNHLLVAGSVRGTKLSERTKQKLREARKKYLETPGAREALSERARKQHAAGKLGAKTWNTGPDYSKPNMKKVREAGAKALAANVKAASSEEMRRRSLLRKNLKPKNPDIKRRPYSPEEREIRAERMRQMYEEGIVGPQSHKKFREKQGV